MARRVKALVAITTVLSAVSFGVVIGAIPASATSLSTYVATTGTNTANTCTSPSRPCLTISYALTQTPTGGTVSVAAGTYAEQVTITKNVTIIGAGSTKTTIEPSAVPLSDSDSDGGFPLSYIVDVAPGVKSANLLDLGVNGSAASGQFSSCAVDYVGVYYHDASGVLSNDLVTDIELPEALFGCQAGLGIYVTTDVGSATPSNVAMQSVTVNNYDKNGITCDDVGTVCSISASTVTGIGATPLIAQNGVQAWGSSISLVGSSITENIYTNPNYPSYYTDSTGVLILNAGSVSVLNDVVSENNGDIDAQEVAGYGLLAPEGQWVFEGNQITNSVEGSIPFGYGVGDGIDIDSTPGNVVVGSNVVTGNPEFGIGLFGASQTSVSSNELSNNGYGIYVGGPGSANAYYGVASALNSSKNSITANTSDKNIVGIYVDTEASANSLLLNTALSNTRTDVVDATTGRGTAGTSDTWLLTTCSTSTPNGICPFFLHLSLPLAPVNILQVLLNQLGTLIH